MLAPKHLGLKISVPVMLLVNLSDKLVNHGLIGRVEKNEVQINFVLDGKNESVAISRYTFTKYDPIDKNALPKGSNSHKGGIFYNNT